MKIDEELLLEKIKKAIMKSVDKIFGFCEWMINNDFSYDEEDKKAKLLESKEKREKIKQELDEIKINREC